MRRTVVQHLVVDLVGEDDELMFARKLDDLFQYLIGIQRTGRVVRVDDDDGARVRRDLAAHVGQIGIPFIGLVADVVARRAARQRDCRRPQRIVGGRHQHFVAGIEQALHRHHDQFGSTVADEDVVDG